MSTDQALSSQLVNLGSFLMTIAHGLSHELLEEEEARLMVDSVSKRLLAILDVKDDAKKR